MSSLERKIFTLMSDFTASVMFAVVAFYLSLWVSSGDSIGVEVQRPWLCLAGLILFFVAFFNDAYSIESCDRLGKFFIRWLFAWLICCFLYFAIFLLLSRKSLAFTPAFMVPRLLPSIFLLLMLPGIPIARATSDKIFQLNLRPATALLMGKSVSCNHFMEEIQRVGFKNWEFIGHLDTLTGVISGFEAFKETKIQLSELAAFVCRTGVSEIILADPTSISNDALAGLLNCFEKGVEILSLEQAFEKTMGKIPVEHLGDGWLPTTFWSHVQVPVFYRAFKRTMDVCGIGILLIGALPIMALSALLIKMTSPGPIIYRQHRVGLHGRRFVIRKFRTMVDNPKDNDEKWTENNDHRITPLGKILRKLRIDELPQLFNVIAGNMSLVGPRPEQPDIADKLEQKIPFFRARGKVLPGITGWAQVMYRYGNSVDDSRIKLEYDLYYIKNRSILLDLIILAKTVRIVLCFKGH